MPKLQVLWRVLEIPEKAKRRGVREALGMLVFWRARGALWKFRGKGISKLAKKRGGPLRFVFQRYSLRV
jgi:hypothetical protein